MSCPECGSLNVVGARPLTEGEYCGIKCYDCGYYQVTFQHAPTKAYISSLFKEDSVTKGWQKWSKIIYNWFKKKG